MEVTNLRYLKDYNIDRKINQPLFIFKVAKNDDNPGSHLPYVTDNELGKSH